MFRCIKPGTMVHHSRTFKLGKRLDLFFRWHWTTFEIGFSYSLGNLVIDIGPFGAIFLW